MNSEVGAVVKETKAQRAERLKREKNPWEAFDEICTYASQGFPAMPPEWLGTYLRWWGVYTQGDGAGVIGGANGEGKAVPYFMVRVRIPNGFLTSQQAREVARLARLHGRDVADITVRQNIQLHWIAAEALPDVLGTSMAIGLATKGACGDVTRNVTGCPLAGLDAAEIVDCSPLVLEVNRLLAGNADFYNLPRKFKVSISGCPSWCSYPEINDVGMTALRRDNGEIGFSVRVGGGLSTQPFLGARLNAFVHWDQVVPVVEAIASMFRDSESLRVNRKRARLKYLFLEENWTADVFQRELERRLGFALEPAVPEQFPADPYRDHVGIQRQHEDGLYAVGASVLRGRLRAEQLERIANLADEYGTGEVRTTNMQNIIVPNVRQADTAAVAREFTALGLPVRASAFWRGAIACTGTEFCKLALTETKSFTQWLVAELEERVPEFDQPLRINVTGCPNSCGQHWVADLGIEGKKIKVGAEMVDAYYFCVGGGLGEDASIARAIGYRCAATEVPEAIERLLRAYLRERGAGEPFRRYLMRSSTEDLRSITAGSLVTPVERDLPAGRVPAGIGD